MCSHIGAVDGRQPPRSVGETYTGLPMFACGARKMAWRSIIVLETAGLKWRSTPTPSQGPGRTDLHFGQQLCWKAGTPYAVCSDRRNPSHLRTGSGPYVRNPAITSRFNTASVFITGADEPTSFVVDQTLSARRASFAFNNPGRSQQGLDQPRRYV